MGGFLELIFSFLKSLYQPEQLMELVRSGGYVVLASIVFAETGLFVGFFLPGDSLLFTAGLVAAQGVFHIGWLIALLCLMAILGDSVGYMVGYRAGVSLYNKPNSFWFRRRHLLYAKEFYEKYGGRAIFLAHFVPFARTFAPVVAGITQLPYPRFAKFMVCGDIFWVCSMCSAGFFLGDVPWVQHNLDKVVLLIIFLSVLPIIIGYLRQRNRIEVAAGK
jgi:membrane-associated protein